jgi:hypothetical protein
MFDAKFPKRTCSNCNHWCWRIGGVNPDLGVLVAPCAKQEQKPKAGSDQCGAWQKLAVAQKSEDRDYAF